MADRGKSLRRRGGPVSSSFRRWLIGVTSVVDHDAVRGLSEARHPSVRTHVVATRRSPVHRRVRWGGAPTIRRSTARLHGEFPAPEASSSLTVQPLRLASATYGQQRDGSPPSEPPRGGQPGGRARSFAIAGRSASRTVDNPKAGRRGGPSTRAPPRLRARARAESVRISIIDGG